MEKNVIGTEIFAANYTISKPVEIEFEKLWLKKGNVGFFLRADFVVKC